MSDVRVIGVGSPFGADCIAKIVIEQLQKKYATAIQSKEVTIDYYDRPGFYLLTLMRDAKQVHIIDAIVSDKPAGFIHRYEDIEIFQQNIKTLSSHGHGVADVLALGKTLNQLPDKIILHGIEMGDDITAAANQLVDQINLI